VFDIVSNQDVNRMNCKIVRTLEYKFAILIKSMYERVHTTSTEFAKTRVCMKLNTILLSRNINSYLPTCELANHDEQWR
jgi:hypothetical protein